MIFDSSEMLALSDKHLNTPVYEIPSIVRLANEAKYKGERLYLETLFKDMPLEKRNRWFYRFVSGDRAQFWGAWFELMLYGWLKPLGNVQFEVDDGQPDFVLTVNKNSSILIEAKTVLTSKYEWLEEKFVSKIFVFLREIQKPYTVRVVNFKISESNAFERRKFEKDIEIWLSNSPDKEYIWNDKYGNEITFVATHEPSIGHAYGVRWSDLNRDTSSLKNALGKKAKQHKKLREQGNPYVIGLFLHSYSFRPRDVIDAWLGQSILRVDRQSGELTHTTDETGLHYSSREIVHTSVSGTLVFLQKYNEASAMRELEPYWIENPFADENIRIDNFIFPVVDRHIVKERSLENITMQWMSEA